MGDKTNRNGDSGMDWYTEEEFNLLESRVNAHTEAMQEMKADVDSVKADVASLKTDFQEIKEMFTNYTDAADDTNTKLGKKLDNIFSIQQAMMALMKGP